MVKNERIPYRLPGDEVERFLDGYEVVLEELSDSGPEVNYDDHTAEIHSRLYDATIHYLDQKIAEIVDGLKETDQWDDTLFVVTSDHGECVGERGLIGHSILYEPGVHVPLVVKPHESSGMERSPAEQRVNVLGIYRTIADLIDEAPDAIHGPDLFGDVPGEPLVLDYAAR